MYGMTYKIIDLDINDHIERYFIDKHINIYIG
jgi:hypothetical protein